MDRMYRLQRHLYDATRKYYLLGRDALIEELAPPPGGTVLEVGCGTGRNLIAAAKRWPQARFFGLDISDAMLATARVKAKRAGVSITFAQGDAAGFDPAPFGVARFDRVFMSYTLSMIPPWEAAIAHARTLLAPGGTLSIVDFGQQESLPRWWRAALLGWLAKWHVTPRADLRAVVERLGGEVSALYGGYAWSGQVKA
jgi:S-adenosylmethionine-diacylgycerolhomoserine-N-methlytransferase